MKSNTFLTFLQIACVATAMLPTLARGQSDTLAISGTFQMDAAYGALSPDLAGVYARGGDHTWTLTLHGVTYENDYIYEGGDGWYDESYITRAQATSFTLEFFGPDAPTLNAAVGNQLAGGGLTNGAMVQLVNQTFFDASWQEQPETYLFFYLQLVPPILDNGVSFDSDAYDFSYTVGYPEFTPRQLWVESGAIEDRQFPNAGSIETYGQLVNIASSVPPQTTPRISILDGAVAEGHKGASRLDLTVKLSGASSNTVAVQYMTVDGTAKSSGSRKSPADYTAATGTLTFQPGQTSRTISVLVNGDRTRESNETFTVQLRGVDGASYKDSVATATILNDD